MIPLIAGSADVYTLRNKITLFDDVNVYFVYVWLYTA